MGHPVVMQTIMNIMPASEKPEKKPKKTSRSKPSPGSSRKKRHKKTKTRDINQAGDDGIVEELIADAGVLEPRYLRAVKGISHDYVVIGSLHPDSKVGI